MTEENKKDEIIDVKTRPKYFLITPSDGATCVIADYAKVFIDGTTKLCTFVFFRRHPTPKETREIVHLGQITDEVFLEVKIPFTAVTDILSFLNHYAKKMNDYEWMEIKFGPVTDTSEEGEGI